MAATTVKPNLDGSTSGPDATKWAQFGGPTTRWECLNNGISTPDDTDYMYSYMQEGDSNEIIFLGFEDMPIDFDTATAVTVEIRQKCAFNDDDNATYQIFKSDETTALTNQLSLALDGTGVSTSYRDDTLNFTITGDTDKTSWDGARLKINHTGPGDGADSEMWISEIELNVTYTAVAGPGGDGAILLRTGDKLLLRTGDAALLRGSPSTLSSAFLFFEF